MSETVGEVLRMYQDRMCRIARDAGLDPNLIPRGDFSIEGDTIRYRYVLLDADGANNEDGVLWKTEWMTAKVGGDK